MKTPPILLALQESTAEAEDKQSMEPSTLMKNLRLRPGNPEANSRPPVVLSKQRIQASPSNETIRDYRQESTEAMEPVTDIATATNIDDEIISTFEPITLEDMIKTTESSEGSSSFTQKTNHIMEEVDYEDPSGTQETPDFQSTPYPEFEDSTLMNTIYSTTVDHSDLSGTPNYELSNTETAASTDFEVATEQTFPTLDESEEDYETSTIIDPSDTDYTTNTDPDLFTVTETPVASTNTLSDFSHIDLPKNGTSGILNGAIAKDIILEASPTTGVGEEVTDIPLIDPSKHDFKIVTTRKGLQVDAQDAVFDPSQIAKATSYQGSSYSTATRSATVTTWVDPNDRNMATQRQSNLTSSLPSDESSHVRYPEGKDKDAVIIPSHTISEVPENVLPQKNSEGTNLKNDEVTTISQHSESNENTTDQELSTDSTSERPDIDLEDVKDVIEKVTLEGRHVESQSGQQGNAINVTKSESQNNVTHRAFGDSKGVHNHTINVKNLPTQRFNLSDINIQNETDLVYGMPKLNVHKNSEVYFSTSVIVALSVCCSVVLLVGLVTLTLWLCRRHKSRSKIYLSHEAARPRAFFTKPMNPALLPNEGVEEPQYVLEFQRPRAPVMLGNDQKDIIFKSKNTEDLGLGLENDGFTDIPLEELKIEGYKKNKRLSQDPPKYGSKTKRESDADSGIRVWSSTGSLYTASPQLTHCSVPPPPYSPSIGEEPVCISVHSLPSLSKKLGLKDI